MGEYTHPTIQMRLAWGYRMAYGEGSVGGEGGGDWGVGGVSGFGGGTQNRGELGVSGAEGCGVAAAELVVPIFAGVWGASGGLAAAGGEDFADI